MVSLPLSICIPTYNRGPYLDELLSSIHREPDAHLIEVCISDNASDDNTEAIVQSWSDRGLRIRFKRQPTNLGPDRNYLAVAEMATSEYIWLIGSDDRVVLGGAGMVIEMIQSFPLTGVFLFSRTERDHDLRKYLGVRHWLGYHETDPLSFDLSNRGDRAQFFSKVLYLGGVFSYLSSIVIRRESWQSIKFAPRFDGTAYSHVYMILEGLLKGDSSVLRVFRYSPIDARLGNDSFFVDSRQRMMLDINGYKMLAEVCFPPDERTLLYSVFRKPQYLGYLRSILVNHYRVFSWQDWQAIATVCGWRSIVRNFWIFLIWIRECKLKSVI